MILQYQRDENCDVLNLTKQGKIDYFCVNSFYYAD